MRAVIVSGRAETEATGDGLRAVAGSPRLWLRIEGLATLAAGAGLYLHLGGQPIWLVPFLLAAAWSLGSPAITLVGAVLVAHVGMDRAAGYGLKYPNAFGDTHLGRLRRSGR